MSVGFTSSMFKYQNLRHAIVLPERDTICAYDSQFVKYEVDFSYFKIIQLPITGRHYMIKHVKHADIEKHCDINQRLAETSNVETIKIHRLVSRLG